VVVALRTSRVCVITLSVVPSTPLAPQAHRQRTSRRVTAAVLSTAWSARRS